ncbi:MAG: hypothetical protein QNK04_21925 [Myxococcota bacterium]|nr:hypothetical protein [Myxococcota bacterium]
MARPHTSVILVSRNDRAWMRACEDALKELGIDAVETYNCWSADFAMDRIGGDAVVIDGRLLCDFVSADRPGPVLSLSPKLPVVVFNGEDLDEQHREAALAHNAVILAGDDGSEIALRVDAVLPST